MRKRTHIFIIIISVLMFYTGCGDDGEDDTAPPGLGGGGFNISVYYPQFYRVTDFSLTNP